ncbi:HNH endonuclease [Tumidithrix helvetica PCC 7403]|uniref:HNH endonuclease n=1 Tax=Tumidithrix helvetica TaxID=3457545 RepID=UPI003CB15641
MAKPRKYTEADFIEAVAASTSISQVLGKLSLRPTGGNYQVTKDRIKHLSLDTQHFKGQGWLKGCTNHAHKQCSLTEILVKDSTYRNTYSLKSRLIKEGIFSRKCSNCMNDQWLSLPIPLELDHINGDRTDNRVENLRLLCPNCHALTDTYRGKNKSLKPPMKERI